MGSLNVSSLVLGAMALSDHWVWPTQPLPTTVEDFIQRIVTQAEGGPALDFTMDYVATLCLNEPDNCGLLLDILEESENEIQEEENNKLVFKSDVNHDNGNDIINTRITKEPELKKILNIPRHIFMLALLPLFPTMLLFTASGGVAFFATAAIEFLSSLVLNEVRTETFGKIWIGFTFLFFSPVIYFTLRVFINMIASIISVNANKDS